MTADPVRHPQEPSWISTPMPGRQLVGEEGAGWDPDLCVREGKRLRSRVRSGALTLSPPHSGLLSAWAGLAPTPGPGPHLELAPQVGHLIQPMLLYAPAAAPLTGVSAPFRFHLVEVDARCWGLASWGRGGGADLPPRPPQYGTEHQPLGDARQVDTCRPP